MKNFQDWHKLKSDLHKQKRAVYFRKKEIWWCSLGLNIGFEQDGKNNNFERPILVLRKFNNDILLVLPLTSRNKTGKYYFQIRYNDKTYSIILSQIRLISSKRLLRRIKKIDRDIFEEIREKVKKLL
ncbi:type II toxin-antitoxin system PemK/MazF family toxin [Candidatus Parcubacteria bacterium]|nr:type II toxin-antitoxin system PemK/MazF family toxin [Candidatus Parcubacteria bacterium]